MSAKTLNTDILLTFTLMFTINHPEYTVVIISYHSTPETTCNQ